MAAVAPPPPRTELVEERIRFDERPRKPREFDRENASWLVGAAVSGFCLAWLVYERLTPLSGGLGFWICWYAAFLVIYAVIVREQRGRVAARDQIATVVITTLGLGLIIPLFAIVIYVIARGGPALRPAFFTQTQEFVAPTSSATVGGGLHAIVGTFEQVGIAMLISVPLAILCALFLNEVGGPLARPTRMVVDAMSAVPSIIAGLFIYAIWILQLHEPPSGLAAALALTVLMLPTITRTSEVVLRLTPNGLREGSLALGGTDWRTARQVVLPTARSGLITGIILGIARCVGETAPLLFTAGDSTRMVWNPLQRQSSLPLFIYRIIFLPQKAEVHRAWTAALVLLIIVLILFGLARVAGARTPGKKGFIARTIARFRRRKPRSATA
jgi:phosphate transport system permease protein